MATFKNYSLVVRKNFAEARSDNKNEDLGSFETHPIKSAIRAGAAGYFLPGFAEEVFGHSDGLQLSRNQARIKNLMTGSRAPTSNDIQQISDTLNDSNMWRLKELTLADLMNPNYYKSNQGRFTDVMEMFIREGSVRPKDLARAFLGRGAKYASEGRVLSAIPFRWGKDFSNVFSGLQGIIDSYSRVYNNDPDAYKIALKDFVSGLDETADSMGGHGTLAEFKTAILTDLNKNANSAAGKTLCRMLEADPQSRLIDSILRDTAGPNYANAKENIQIALKSLNLNNSDVLQKLKIHGYLDQQVITKSLGQAAGFVPDNIYATMRDTAEKMTNLSSSKFINENLDNEFTMRGQSIGKLKDYRNELRAQQVFEQYAKAIQDVDTIQSGNNPCQDILSLQKELNDQHNFNTKGLSVKNVSGDWKLSVDTDKFAKYVSADITYTYTKELNGLIYGFNNINDNSSLKRWLILALEYIKAWGSVFLQKIRIGRFIPVVRDFDWAAWKKPSLQPTVATKGKPGYLDRIPTSQDSKLAVAKKVGALSKKKVGSGIVGAGAFVVYNWLRNPVKNEIEEILSTLSSNKSGIFKYNGRYFNERGIFGYMDGSDNIGINEALKRKLSEEIPAWYRRQSTTIFSKADNVSDIDCEMKGITPLFVAADITCNRARNENAQATLIIRILYSSKMKLNLTDTEDKEWSIDTGSVDIVKAKFSLKTQIKYEKFLKDFSQVESENRGPYVWTWDTNDDGPIWDIQPVTNIVNKIQECRILPEVRMYNNQVESNPLKNFGFSAPQKIPTKIQGDNPVKFNKIAKSEDRLSN